MVERQKSFPILSLMHLASLPIFLGLVGCGPTLNTSTSNQQSEQTPISVTTPPKNAPVSDINSSIQINQIGNLGYKMDSAVGISASRVKFKTSGGYQVSLSAASRDQGQRSASR